MISQYFIVPGESASADLVPPHFPPDASLRGEEGQQRTFLDPKVISSSRGTATSRLHALLRRPFVEDGAKSLLIEPQTESVFVRELGNLFFSIFLVYRPKAFQVLVVNYASPPFAMYPSFDLFR